MCTCVYINEHNLNGCWQLSIHSTCKNNKKPEFCSIFGELGIVLETRTCSLDIRQSLMLDIDEKQGYYREVGGGKHHGRCKRACRGRQGLQIVERKCMTFRNVLYPL